MSKVLVYIADGMEEVECLSVVDMLRRGGVETQMVSINGKTEVIGAHSRRGLPSGGQRSGRRGHAVSAGRYAGHQVSERIPGGMRCAEGSRSGRKASGGYLCGAKRFRRAASSGREKSDLLSWL